MMVVTVFHVTTDDASAEPVDEVPAMTL